MYDACKYPYVYLQPGEIWGYSFTTILIKNVYYIYIFICIVFFDLHIYISGDIGHHLISSSCRSWVAGFTSARLSNEPTSGVAKHSLTTSSFWSRS